MQFKVYKDKIRGQLLVVFPELERGRGFTVIEPCEPGIWIGSTHPPIIEMVPKTHPFYHNAKQINYPSVFGLMEGGRDKAEKLVKYYVELLDEYIKKGGELCV